MAISFLSAFDNKGKLGYKNRLDKVIIKAIFDEGPPEFNHLSEVLVFTRKDAKKTYYLFDFSGTRLFSFNDIIAKEIVFVERCGTTDLFLVHIYVQDHNNLVGMVDMDGKIILAPIFNSIETIAGNLFKVCYSSNSKMDESGDLITDKFGIYNAAGKEIFTPQFVKISDFRRSTAVAHYDNSAVLIYRFGQIIEGTESNSIERLGPNHFLLNKKEGCQLFLLPDTFSDFYDLIEYTPYPNLHFTATKALNRTSMDWYLKEV